MTTALGMNSSSRRSSLPLGPTASSPWADSRVERQQAARQMRRLAEGSRPNQTWKSVAMRADFAGASRTIDATAGGFAPKRFAASVAEQPQHEPDGHASAQIGQQFRQQSEWSKRIDIAAVRAARAKYRSCLPTDATMDAIHGVNRLRTVRPNDSTHCAYRQFIQYSDRKSHD